MTYLVGFSIVVRHYLSTKVVSRHTTDPTDTRDPRKTPRSTYPSVVVLNTFV